MNVISSGIYECSVVHCRLLPKRNEFTYQVFMLCAELEEIPRLAKRIPWLSHNGFNLFALNDRDHIDLGLPGGIRPNLIEWLSRQGVSVPDDCRIQLVTFPSVLGYGFNPVSFYHFFTLEGEALLAVAEVTNTYREMKLFVVAEKESATMFHQRVAKDFYVSPFSDPAHEFDFRLGIPAEKWRVNIDDYENGERMLLSSIWGEYSPLSSARLLWYAVKYPLLSVKIIVLIHWHALLLWIKKVPFYRKTDRREHQLNVLRPHQSLTKPEP